MRFVRLPFHSEHIYNNDVGYVHSTLAFFLFFFIDANDFGSRGHHSREQSIWNILPQFYEMCKAYVTNSSRPKNQNEQEKKSSTILFVESVEGKKIMKLQKDFLSAQRFIIFLLLFRTIVHSLTHSLSPSYLELPLSCN